MNTLLMGLRGCGKSTVGRLLAGRLGCVFVELDERVLAIFDQGTVSEAWSVHGEPAWRAAEARVLEDCLAATDQVVALGGGTPMIEEARRLIEREQAGGRVRVVYLVCDPRELARRLAEGAGDRPPLLGTDPVSEIGTYRVA